MLCVFKKVRKLSWKQKSHNSTIIVFNSLFFSFFLIYFNEKQCRENTASIHILYIFFKKQIFFNPFFNLYVVLFLCILCDDEKSKKKRIRKKKRKRWREINN